MIQKYLIDLAIALAVIASAAGLGYWKGTADTTNTNLVEHVESLNKSIDDLNKETKKAGKLNLQLSQTINARKKADDESTKVFANALAATSHLRVNCVFDDSIMQQLYEAADRADQAASSGFTSPLRTGDPPH